MTKTRPVKILSDLLMNRAISDSGGICQELAEFGSEINTTLLSDGAVAVTVTFADADGEVPESRIELEYGQVTDYEIHLGPYPTDENTPYSVLDWSIREAVERDNLFPNGDYEIDRGDKEYIVEFSANLLFSRRRDSRPVEAVISDIKTLLELREAMHNTNDSS